MKLRSSDFRRYVYRPIGVTHRSQTSCRNDIISANIRRYPVSLLLSSTILQPVFPLMISKCTSSIGENPRKKGHKDGSVDLSPTLNCVVTWDEVAKGVKGDLVLLMARGSPRTKRSQKCRCPARKHLPIYLVMSGHGL